MVRKLEQLQEKKEKNLEDRSRSLIYAFNRREMHIRHKREKYITKKVLDNNSISTDLLS